MNESPTSPPPLRRFGRIILTWMDNAAATPAADDDERIDLLRILPFIALHLAVVAACWTGVSPVALGVGAGLFVCRMFAITAFYHRYLSHRTFQANRLVVFLGCLLAGSSAQRGPLWWAAHHRHHHRHSDETPDSHSPKQHGFWRAHVLWFLTRGAFRTRAELVPDLARHWELRLLDRFDWLPPLLLALACFGFGAWCEAWWPAAGTSAWQMLVVGFLLSTVLLFHATFTVNSLAHRWGSRPYATPDDSRNNLLLALLTLGEGWHNNHHFYPNSARQGFRWWEIDPTWYVLRLLQFCGVISGLRGVPARVLARRGDERESQR